MNCQQRENTDVYSEPAFEKTKQNKKLIKSVLYNGPYGG